MNLHSEHHMPERNSFRFYALEVGQDLFGAWCLQRRWGRIGTGGNAKRASYASEAEAVAAAEAIARRKAWRGYEPRPLAVPAGPL